MKCQANGTIPAGGRGTELAESFVPLHRGAPATMSHNSVQTGHSQASCRLYRLLTNPRSRYLLLQSLVSIILSYELLFGSDSIISRVMSDGLVVGLWLFIVSMAVMPAGGSGSDVVQCGTSSHRYALGDHHDLPLRERQAGSLYCVFCAHAGRGLREAAQPSVRPVHVAKYGLCGSGL